MTTCEGVYVTGYRRGKPCPYRATAVIHTSAYLLRVCGYHARAWTPESVYPLDWNLARIRRWRLGNLDRLLGRDDR